MKRVILFIATNLAVMLVLSLTTSLLGFNRFIEGNGLNMGALLGFAAVFGFLGSFISLWMSKWIAKTAYNIQIIESPRSEAERWLFETIQEQAKIAEIPMPEVGVYDSPEANAFATGPSRNNALVAVSSGLLSSMRKREVEGVLAHEIAHIANGDMVTMTLLQGVLNTFVIFISRVVGFVIDRAISKNDDERSGVGFGYYIAVFVCEIVFGMLASMVVMWHSRRREFSADADAARIWGRDPIRDALVRLKEITENGGVLDDRSKALAAFKINHPGGWMKAFASHPPLEERIEALNKMQ